ncbi:MAG: copper resistance CopC/CopD family protein [Gemmatimonadaceae bacterium]
MPTSRRTAAIAAASLAMLLSPLDAAQAHGRLKGSVPAAGAHVPAAPRMLRLEFTEAPELPFARVELRGPTGTAVPLGALRVDPASPAVLMAPLVPEALPAGVYTVQWQIAGADGHPVRGEFVFTVTGSAGAVAPADSAGAACCRGGPAPGVAPPAAHHTGAPASFDAESPAYVLLRWVSFAALVVAIGAVVFPLIVLPLFARIASEPARLPVATEARRRARRAGTIAALVLGLLAVLRLIAQSYALHGAAHIWHVELVRTMVLDTVWGWGWLLQVAGVALALAAFSAARGPSRAAWGLAALAALALSATPALSGHAVAAPRVPTLAVLADSLHVLSAGGWLGSLVLLVVAGIPAARQLEEENRGESVADLVNAFSPTALAFAALLGATGVFSAWIQLGAWAALWDSPYGRTLLVKLGVLGLMLATGAFNWLRVRPALGDAEGTRLIRRTSTIEIGIGVVVLLVTAVLVATATPAAAGVAAAQ